MTMLDQSSGVRGGGTPLKCLLAMVGTDAHNKGIRTLARLLRDEGIEVVYLGDHNTPADVVAGVLQEDPDVVGLSFSVATYTFHVAALLKEMRCQKVDDVPVIIGGLIHDDDEKHLRELGVAEIFGPKTTFDDVRDFMQRLATGTEAAVEYE